ncbi:MAG: hypothetical protein NDJ19_10485 [Ramlibacter sp.]|nr:hypothetical protein [Ramlibacter sp.]
MNLSGNFVLLRADSLRLLLPQQDVGAAQYLEHAPRPAGEPGLYEVGQGDDLRPVIALSREMKPLARFPADRFVLASLHAAGSTLSFAWNEVQVLIGATLERRELPAVMRAPGAPVDAYVEHDGHVVLCATAERVISYAMAGR